MNKKEALTELLRDRDLTIQTTENYFPLYSSEESSENHEIVHISVKIPELPFAKVYNTLDIVAPKDVGTQTLDPGYTPLIKDLFSYDFFSDFNIPHLNDTVSFDENNTQTYASDEMQMDFADQEVLGLETPLFNEEFEDTYHCSDYDPASLVDLTTNSSRIIALPFKKAGSDTPVYIPVNFMQNIFGKVGTGAGDSPAEAKIDALYDCIAQYVKLQVVTNSFAMPRIDSDESNEHPDFLNTLAELESVHDEAMVNVAFFDASLGGKYPVVCCAVFGSDEVNRPMLNVAFAANLDLSKAMKKAYLQAMTTILNPYQNTPDCEDEPIFKYRLVYDTSSVMNLQNIEGISLNTGGLLPFEIFMSANSDYPLSTIDRKLTADDEYRTLVEIITREDKSIYFYTFNDEFNVVKQGNVNARIESREDPDPEHSHDLELIVGKDNSSGIPDSLNGLGHKSFYGLEDDGKILRILIDIQPYGGSLQGRKISIRSYSYSLASVDNTLGTFDSMNNESLESALKLQNDNVPAFTYDLWTNSYYYSDIIYKDNIFDVVSGRIKTESLPFEITFTMDYGSKDSLIPVSSELLGTVK